MNEPVSQEQRDERVEVTYSGGAPESEFAERIARHFASTGASHQKLDREKGEWYSVTEWYLDPNGIEQLIRDIIRDELTRSRG